MRTFILVFSIALAVTLVSTPWMRRSAIAMGFVDAPEKRKVHTSPVPLLGGVAIFAGAIIATLLVYRQRVPPQVIGALLAGTLVAAIGLIDDRRRLPPWLRLVVQFVAFLVLVAFGIQVRLPLPAAVNYTLTFLWLVGITNAINLLDNMDGLSAGVSGVAAAFMALIGAMNGQYLVSALAAAILGACIGFLRYNFAPAQIFMGDAGAYFLGFWLAVLGIQLRFPQNVNFVTWMVPVMVLGLPIFDTTLVVVSRLRRGLHPFTAGKDHLSHRLVARGFSQRESVLILYLVAGIFGMVGLFIMQADVLEGYLIGGIVFVSGIVGIWYLDKPMAGSFEVASQGTGDKSQIAVANEDSDPV